MATAALSMNLSACSDKEEDPAPSPDILGLWECIEVVVPLESEYHRWFEEGSAIKFFSGTFTNRYYGIYAASGSITGQKCLIDTEGDGFQDYSEEYLPNPTEEFWNAGVSQNPYGDSDFEWDRNNLYILEGNTLSIIESDLDRCVGTISITDDIMTYTYVYQNYTLQTGMQIEEDEGPGCVKFQRKTRQ